MQVKMVRDGRQGEGRARNGDHLQYMHRATVLYDADCGFCKWTLAKLLAWDRNSVLRPVSLQSVEAGQLLRGMDEEQKMSSWHLVTADGRVASGGAAFAPLAELLPGGRPLAAVAARLPRASDRSYRWVADRRTPLGKAVRALGGERAARRAARRIAERS
jgi:predicted DCC family thiol-disulfide oxidoreductase YuxK